ncbi:MAG TPA: NADH-ubiquinone oxidoreductase-F iron-sulfur binding region domain-containing protein [Thermoleophilaceae bacterium]
MSLPRLLAGVRPHAPLALAEHERIHGALRAQGPALIEAVERAGLRGRGGASFPAALKMADVARRRGPRTLLVNAAEGEPMSAKDRLLIQSAPQLVLDGALAAADAVGARSIVIAVPADSEAARGVMRHALAERPGRRRFSVVDVPAAHLAGEESALINYLGGGPLKPTLVPPRPSERGLRRRPTLVQNPETLAHVALIARHGPTWFRELGLAAHPGSALVTVSGAVRDQGVYEVACGTPLRSLLTAAGGGELEPLRAALVGGYHGIWIDADQLEAVTLDDACLRRYGGSLGAGVVVALGKSACPVQELARTLAWLASESAGQCGPCSNGLPALAELLAAIAAGRGGRDARERLDRWSGDIAERGACRLPDGAARFLRSGMGVFGAELVDHALRGPCAGCRRLPTLQFTRGGGRRTRVAA